MKRKTAVQTGTIMAQDQVAFQAGAGGPTDMTGTTHRIVITDQVAINPAGSDKTGGLK